METRTAIILCGGKGSRLGSIAKKLPKTLVKIHSNPILWFVLKNLQRKNDLVDSHGYTLWVF